MCGVFPKLGTEIGVTSLKFGILVAMMGLGRTLVFALGTWKNTWVRDRRICTLAQVLAAGTVAVIPFTNAHWWLGLVFASIGIETGTTYYRSLYASLAGEHSRGLKSGIHEATLFMGMFTGAVGGGLLAHLWDIRAPYIPIASFAFIVLIIQEVLFRRNKRVYQNP